MYMSQEAWLTVLCMGDVKGMVRVLKLFNIDKSLLDNANMLVTIILIK
jgi:hypothetical protein